jgi:hypothetical protein
VWHEDVRGDRTAFGGRGSLGRDGGPLGPSFRLDGAVTTVYQSAAAEASIGVRLGRLILRPCARFGWGSDSMPLQATFPLGGDEGFPGLRLTERRGSQELLFGISAIHPVIGPLAVRGEVMAGAVGSGTGFLRRGASYDGEWLEGVRAGVQIRTPLGLVRLEEGVNSAGDWSGFVRTGTWF